MQHSDPDLPWQVSAPYMVRFGAPTMAYQLGHAIAVISSPDAANIRLLALIVPPEHQREGAGSRLLRALAARHPGKSWFIPPLCPEQYGGFLIKQGFQQDRLNQVLMQADL
jgi:GNAT superfamily N-acetyltransferase